MGISDRVTVLDHGEKIAEGTRPRSSADAGSSRRTWAAARRGRADRCLLELRDVHTYYGNIHALKGVTLHVEVGEIVTLIGSNGAGKSTTLKTISGLLRPRQGEVCSTASASMGRRPTIVVAKGICQSPEGPAHLPAADGPREPRDGGVSRPQGRSGRRLRAGVGLFPRLKERLGQNGGTLSGGEQQMLAIGGRSWRGPSSSSSTSRRWAWRRSWSSRSSRSSGDQRQWDDRPARRAERADGARHRGARVHPADGRDRAARQRRRSLKVNPEVQKAYLSGGPPAAVCRSIRYRPDGAGSHHLAGPRRLRRRAATAAIPVASVAAAAALIGTVSRSIDSDRLGCHRGAHAGGGWGGPAGRARVALLPQRGRSRGGPRERGGRPRRTHGRLHRAARRWSSSSHELADLEAPVFRLIVAVDDPEPG